MALSHPSHMFLRLHLLLGLPLLLLPSCQSQKKREKPAVEVKETEDKYQKIVTPIGQGILIPFTHNILLDVTSGSDGRTQRKILLQTLNQPAEDARRQLSSSLELAGFKSIGSQIGSTSEIQLWSKDGKPMDETLFGISIQTTPLSDPRNPSVTGMLGIDISRAAN